MTRWFFEIYSSSKPIFVCEDIGFQVFALYEVRNTATKISDEHWFSYDRKCVFNNNNLELCHQSSALYNIFIPREGERSSCPNGHFEWFFFHSSKLSWNSWKISNLHLILWSYSFLSCSGNFQDSGEGHLGSLQL